MLPALIDLLKAKQEDDEIVLQVLAVLYSVSSLYTGFPLSGDLKELDLVTLYCAFDLFKAFFCLLGIFFIVKLQKLCI